MLPLKTHTTHTGGAGLEEKLPQNLKEKPKEADENRQVLLEWNKQRAEALKKLAEEE